MTDDELAARRKPGNKRGRKAGSPAGPVSGATAIIAKERTAKAIQLRVAGATLEQIAVEVGYADPSGAHAAIMRGLREILPDTTREEARRLELARLDRLEMAHWANALAGDDKAAVVVLRCISVRSKLLGLDAPQQVVLNVNDGELVRIDVLQLLDDKALENAKALRTRMQELAEMKAGAIDA